MLDEHVFFTRLQKLLRAVEIPHVVVALSGGADSMCLTYLLNKYRLEYQPHFKITAVTVDHGYRPESALEAVKIAEIMNRWGIDHRIRKLDYGTSVDKIRNFEEVARLKRYEQFKQNCDELGVKELVMGHNQDDQLETYLQRLQQLSTMLGLQGLQSKSNLPMLADGPYYEPISLLRPLLDFSKPDIKKYCVKNNVTWFEDYTNADIHLTKRNLLRHILQLDNRETAISRKNLLSTINDISIFNEKLELRALQLKKYISDDSKIDERNGSIYFEIPFSILNKDNNMLISRVLRDILEKFSSVKHYYWSYAKFERHLVPQLIETFEKGQEAKFTYFNLLITSQLKRSGVLGLTCVRQPIIRDDIERLTINIKIQDRWSKWLLFDRRFWMRLKLTSKNEVSIQPYVKKLHKSLVLDTPVENLDSLDGVPLVFSGGKLVSIPTYGFHDNIDIDCSFKGIHSS